MAANAKAMREQNAAQTEALRNSATASQDDARAAGAEAAARIRAQMGKPSEPDGMTAVERWRAQFDRERGITEPRTAGQDPAATGDAAELKDNPQAAADLIANLDPDEDYIGMGTVTMPDGRALPSTFSNDEIEGKGLDGTEIDVEIYSLGRSGIVRETMHDYAMGRYAIENPGARPDGWPRAYENTDLTAEQIMAAFRGSSEEPYAEIALKHRAGDISRQDALKAIENFANEQMGLEPPHPDLNLEDSSLQTEEPTTDHAAAETNRQILINTHWTDPAAEKPEHPDTVMGENGALQPRFEAVAMLHPQTVQSLLPPETGSPVTGRAPAFAQDPNAHTIAV